MVSDLLIARLEKRIAELESKFSHLYVRSELTLFVLSSIIGAGVVKKEGVAELVQNVSLDGFGVPAISEQERKIVLEILSKVTVTK
ncbi:hypothetical protein Pcaca04_23970 [Pectobacterium carotovorum subsp. carotovorum]|nr:hypothetical protein Pcaca04_23970 [Pectobacterium carotovorum subsp. carotovorum]